MTSARRHGNGRVDLVNSIKKVKEICNHATDSDAQAALLEHNGDVQAAVMSLLDNPFQPVEKKKKRPQKPVEREERSNNRDLPFRDNDRRGHDKSRGGRGRGDRDRPTEHEGYSGRGRGRGGRGRGRGPPREKGPVVATVDVTAAENDLGSEGPAYAPPPVEDISSHVVPRVQPQAAPRPVSSTVINDGSVSWASKVKENAAPLQAVFEQPDSNDFEDRAYHDASNDIRAVPPSNALSAESLEADPVPTPPIPTPQTDTFGSGYGHDAQGSGWDNAHGSAHQTPAWSTSVAASPELPLQEHLEDQQSQLNQHQNYDQSSGLPVNSQAFSESKPFDLRDLGASLPAPSTVPEDTKPASDFFEIPTQDSSSQPPGFGPPGLQQNSPLSMFGNVNRSAAPPAAEGTGVGSESRDAASLISSGFPDFGHGMVPVSMPPAAAPVQHHGTAPQPQPQPAHHAHAQSSATQQPPQAQDISPNTPQPTPQNQQEPSTQQPGGAQLQTDAHSQHAHSFEPQFPGHAPAENRATNAKVSTSTSMFMTDHTPGERLNDGPQSQGGPQNSQDQDKQYPPGEKGPNAGSDQQHQPLHGQSYQQLPHDVNSWGMPAIQPDLYNMQRPGSAQLTPPGMQGMVPGMGQIPNQMQAQYPMNPNMPAPGYGAPGYPAPSYPQQLGYAPPYMNPGYNMQYGYGNYGQIAPQAYAPSQPGPQMYGAPSGNFGKGGGYMGDYSARGAPAGSAGGVPGAGSGRGRGRGKNQKGRMPPNFSPQGGMHSDPYSSSQGGYMDHGWMAQNQRYDGGFKDSKGGHSQYPPPFAPGGYENPPGAYGYGGGQFPQHSQFQQSWNSQDKGVGGAKGNF